GLRNGQTVSVLGPLSCSTTATSSSNAGSYPSQCSGASDANYAVTYVNGSVNVAQAVLTVTANNQTMVFGGPVPTLTATITGFVNGQTLATSGVTGAPSCSTTATTSSPGGTYPITCSLGTLGATNYSFTFVSGTLTVGFSSTVVCNYFGELNLNAGQSVLIPPGCYVIGDVDVHAGGSLEAQGAVVLGSVSSVSGATLQFCSTNIGGLFTASGDTRSVVLGDGGTCGGDTIVGAVSLASNTTGVSIQGCRALAFISLSSNAGGARLSNCSVAGYVAVTSNSGGTTVTNNTVLGYLRVTGNSGTVVDHPNTVWGSQTLQ
ncbi:MAG TPA: MBG domain-containing protein, partial [Acidimicrobiales bacterium]|nr:MBG domain-containing protein [Acidimicrobiales bacterium]